MTDRYRPAARFAAVEISLIRQINALANEKTINLGIGEPNVLPDEHFRELAERATRGSWSYSANAGALSERRAIVEGLAIDIDPEREICLTAGTEEGLYAILQGFVEAGDEVLVPDPGFLAYETLVRLAGGTVVRYQLDPEAWEVDLESFRGRLSSRTKLIIVNSPSNPTGGVLSRATLESIAALGAERGIIIVSDEVYTELHDSDRPASMLGMSDGVIVIGGMSKSHAMTGLRLGWMIAPEPIMRTLIKAHQYIATCASVFSQKLAALVFSEAEWNRQWLERVRAQFRLQRDAALAATERFLQPVNRPRGAFYLFVPVPSCDTVSLAMKMAREGGVLAIPGAAFGPGGEGFLRLSYAAPVETISAGIERIGLFLDRAER